MKNFQNFMEIRWNLYEKSFEASCRKYSHRFQCTLDWSQLTDRWVFPEESLVSTKIFLRAWRGSDPQRDDSTENDESAGSPSFNSSVSTVSFPSLFSRLIQSMLPPTNYSYERSRISALYKIDLRRRIFIPAITQIIIPNNLSIRRTIKFL